jgi:hypothetical protein
MTTGSKTPGGLPHGKYWVCGIQLAGLVALVAFWRLAVVTLLGMELHLHCIPTDVLKLVLAFGYYCFGKLGFVLVFPPGKSTDTRPRFVPRFRRIRRKKADR